MLRLVLRRLLTTIPLALGAATLVFVLLETAPGTPADALLGERAIPPATRERLAAAYGFGEPPLARYGHWLAALALHGELGWSHSRGRPVAAEIALALPVTLELAAAALAVNLAAGVALGLAVAACRRRWIVRGLESAALVLYSMPTFWLALMAILLLADLLPLFPASSIASVGAADAGWALRLLDRLWHLALPAAVLGLASAAATSRFVEAGLSRAVREGFVRAARGRGLAAAPLLARHALPNALLPLINLMGVSLPALLSGSLVIEVVFARPGMGRLTYDAIRAQDFPLVMASTLLATLLVAAGSLAADVAMAAADPRIRLAAPEVGAAGAPA